MANLCEYWSLYLTLLLALVFLSAQPDNVLVGDIEPQMILNDKLLSQSEVGDGMSRPSVLKYGKTDLISEEVEKPDTTITQLLDSGTGANYSVATAGDYKSNLSKAYPFYTESLIKNGKLSSVDLEASFKKVLARDTKPEYSKIVLTKDKINPNVKSEKSSTAAKDTKYAVYSAKNQWQPSSRELVNIYKKVYASGKLSKTAITSAFKYYEQHKSAKGLSDKYLVVADYTKVAKEKRMHLINLKNGEISSYFVAHGKRSGPVGGRVYRTSNRRNSHMTSKGFFKVGYKEGRTRKKGYKYLPITGLEKANRKVGMPSRYGGRDVVIHTAQYVNRGGRSFGCFSIRPQDKKKIFSKIKGALLYSYAG